MLGTLSNFNYFLLGIIWVICIFAIAIWVDKMAKIIVGNYVLGIICMAINNVISLVINHINTIQINDPNASYSQLQTFLVTGKTGIILIFYLILLIILLTKTKIHVETSHMPLPKAWIMTIMVIMTVISILLTIAIAVRGIQIVDYSQVLNIAKSFVEYPLLYNVIQYIPLVLLVHGLVTLYLISEFEGE